VGYRPIVVSVSFLGVTQPASLLPSDCVLNESLNPFADLQVCTPIDRLVFAFTVTTAGIRDAGRAVLHIRGSF
jgi:hypothetical protein